MVVWLGPMRELCTRRRMTGTNGEGKAGQGELGWEGERGWCWRLTEARPDMSFFLLERGLRGGEEGKMLMSVMSFS